MLLIHVNIFEDDEYVGLCWRSLNVGLHVADILRFVELPNDAAVDSGRSHVFNCLAKGNPTPTVTWQRSGVDASFKLDILPNNSLIIRIAKPEDSGFYACIAENDRGKIMKDFTIMIIGGLTNF